MAGKDDANNNARLSMKNLGAMKLLCWLTILVNRLFLTAIPTDAGMEDSWPSSRSILFA